MFGRQVMLFPGVFLEVVQLDPVVLVELDQLPVAHADHSAGKPALVAVVRIVPEDRVALGIAPPQGSRATIPGT